LGGALATLAALFLALQGYEVECVTFGCPKVGDEDWTSNFMGFFSGGYMKSVHLGHL